MQEGEGVAGNPRIYAQLVSTLGKFSKFSDSIDKANVGQTLQDDASGADDSDAAPEPDNASADAAAAPAEFNTLMTRKAKAAAEAAAGTAAPTGLPDASF